MELLWKLNSWWEDKDWESRDKHIREWNAQSIKWYPRWLETIPLDAFGLNFVIGPRQVGKTTGLKLLVKHLLSRVKNEFQVFYLDLELITDLREFREVLLYYLKERKKENVRNSFILLDEVSSLDEWFRVVKGFIDMGEFERDVIIATGSSTANVLKHAEAFSGRRGKGKDVVVMPLSFPEFVEITGVDVRIGERIKEAFERYLVTGGMPKSVNGIFSEDDFIKALEREIMILDKNYELAKRILSVLFDMVPSALSYHSVAQKLGISHKTVESYIQAFEDMFLAKVIYWKYEEVNFRKEKKIMLRDPFFVRSLTMWCNKEMRKDFLYEWVVQEHVYRKFGEIYYYRNKYEIDCIAGNLKIEVKAGKPHRRYPRNVLVLEEKDVPGFILSRC